MLAQDPVDHTLLTVQEAEYIVVDQIFLDQCHCATSNIVIVNPISAKFIVNDASMTIESCNCT